MEGFYKILLNFIWNL